jgi:hypothetical protein
MDVDPQQPQQYTILRIKRKRTDEPLDALGMFSEITIYVHLRFDMGFLHTRSCREPCS